MKKSIWALLVLAILALLAFSWPWLKDHLQSMAVLREVADQPEPWVLRAVTGPVRKQEVTFGFDTPTGVETVRARIYIPASHPDAPAMVVLHGIHHLGIDEPRLMGFAAALASCGIRVLTPELPGIKDYHVSEESVTTIGESVKWLAAQTGHPVGVMGLSFAGGLALVAAVNPRYHTGFKFVFALGAHDSMNRVAEYYRTGTDDRPDGTVEHLTPHEYGPLVLEYEYLSDLLPPSDLVPVGAVLRSHLYENNAAEKRALLALNEIQKREALALMNSRSADTQARIAMLAAKHSDEMTRLSPHGHLKTLNTPVFLLHGEADNVIPAAETLWLASELPPKDLKEEVVTPVLTHVDVGEAGPSLRDEWKLVDFFAGVLKAGESTH